MRRELFLVPLTVFLLGAGIWAVRHSQAYQLSRHKLIGGDGGPLVVLQGGIVSKWRGAANFDNSLTNGGSIETDYDVACRCTTNHVRHYKREMLVLNDSEWPAQFVQESSDTLIIFQPYDNTANLLTSIELERNYKPLRSFQFNLQDSALRLIAGADDGRGTIYGFDDVKWTPGIKRVRVYNTKNAFIVTLKNE